MVLESELGNAENDYFKSDTSITYFQVIGPTNRDILNLMLSVAAMEVASYKHKDKFPNKGRLLSLDGGGIRGLILVQMLLELEGVLGKSINSCFDWLAGTSTGGILALGKCIAAL